MSSEPPAVPNFDSFWDFNHPKEIEERFSRLLPEARAAKDRSYLAELLTQIARARGLQQRFEEAHETLDEAEKLLATVRGRAEVRYLLERGRVFNSSKRPDEALPLFLKARDRAMEIGEDFYAVDAAHMLAIVEPPERQLEWAEWAISHAEKSRGDRARGWLGSLYNNTGWTYHELGRYEDALDMFQRGLDWQKSQGKEVEAAIAAWTVARALRSLGQVEEALVMQRENLERCRSDGRAEVYVEEEIGECLLLLERGDEAVPHFARVYELLKGDPWLQRDEPDRLRRLAELGEVP